MRAPALLVALALVACHSPASSSSDASPSAPPASASAPATTAPPAYDESWLTIASKSKVAAAATRTQAQNAVRMLPPEQQASVDATLNHMAKEPPTADGIRDAAQLARDAQDQAAAAGYSGAGKPPAYQAIAQAGFLVLQGLVVASCEAHGDAASARALLAELRVMPLPRGANAGSRTAGFMVRTWLEQEMSATLDAKVYASAKAKAPSPKRNPP